MLNWIQDLKDMRMKILEIMYQWCTMNITLTMRCALIIPAWVPEDIFSSKTASSQINYWQPLGTLYVAAVLQKKVMK